MKLLLIFLVCFPLIAEDELSKSWKISMAAFAVSQALDSASSYGCYEGNPFLRSGDGRFGSKGLLLKASITTGIFLMERAILHRHSSLSKYLTIANYAASGVTSTQAGWNWSH